MRKRLALLTFLLCGAISTPSLASDFMTLNPVVDGVLFANLPAQPQAGSLVMILDSSTATFGATISGGGSNIVLAMFNGFNWVVV